MSDAAATLHPMANTHVPGYLANADGTDPLFTVVTIFVIVVILGIGVFYFALHSLPERMAHDTNHMQLQMIGILCLIALFTHNNLFWLLALLIAAVRVPDFLTPLRSIARSLRVLSRRDAKGGDDA